MAPGTTTTSAEIDAAFKGWSWWFDQWFVLTVYREGELPRFFVPVGVQVWGEINEAEARRWWGLPRLIATEGSE